MLKWYGLIAILIAQISCQKQNFTKLAKSEDRFTYDDLRQLEKASFVLTGHPLDTGSREQLSSGSLSPEDWLDQILSSEAFQWESARFWSATLGIKERLDIRLMRNKNGQTILNAIRGNNTNVVLGDREPTPDQMSRYINQVKRPGPKRLVQRSCDNRPIIVNQLINQQHRERLKKVVAEGKYWNGSELQIEKTRYAELLRLIQEFHPECNSAQLQEATTYWYQDQDQKLLVAQKLFDQDYCQENLRRCVLNNSVPGDYLSEVNAVLTLEPGLIISKTIADNLPISRALTTTKTVVNEPLAYFYRNQMPFWDNFPGGEFEEDNLAMWLTPKGTGQNNRSQWIERTQLHAGPLSTFAFHMVTNGRRAKANRVYEALLCRKFTVDPDIHPDPSDDNPDLAKRTYCAACHKTLEPLASLFQRWPETGMVNYLYDTEDSTTTTGAILGKPADGYRELAQIVANSTEFSSCMIKRTFQFIFGRTMSPDEEYRDLPNYLQVLTNNEGQLKPVMKQMVRSSTFRQGVQR